MSHQTPSGLMSSALSYQLMALSVYPLQLWMDRNRRRMETHEEAGRGIHLPEVSCLVTLTNTMTSIKGSSGMTLTQAQITSNSDLDF